MAGKKLGSTSSALKGKTIIIRATASREGSRLTGSGGRHALDSDGKIERETERKTG